MSMCGFNAYQVKNGSCKRGERLCKTFIPEFRGALWPNTVANHIVTISLRRKVLNRNKLIVFANEYFGIFPSHEVFMLANVPVRDTERELNMTRDQVYAKYTDAQLIEKS